MCPVGCPSPGSFSGDHSLARGRAGNAAFWCLAALLALYSAYIRFDGITEFGIMEFHIDGWRYLNAGQQWAQGNIFWMEGGVYYRPAIHLLHAGAIKLFGSNDYSIKIVNSVLDLLTIGLLFWGARLLTGNRWAALLTAALYALLAPVLELVWSEYPHAPSAFLVSLSFCLFLASYLEKRGPALGRLLLAVSGLCVGLCANMHLELASLGPAYIGCIALLEFAKRPNRHGVLQFILSSAVFTLAFFVPCLLIMTLVGVEEAFTVFLQEVARGPQVLGNKYGSMGVWSCLVDLLCVSSQGFFGGSLVMPLVFAAAVVLAITHPLWWRRLHPFGLVPLVLIAGYGIMTGITVRSFVLWRLFLPLLPLFLVFIACWLYAFLQVVIPRYAGIAFAATSIALFIYAPLVTPQTKESPPFGKATFREVYDAIGDGVDDEHRLMVLPVISWAARNDRFDTHWSLSNEIYFGDHAVSVRETPDFQFPYTASSLEAIRRDYNIGYVYIDRTFLREETTLYFEPRFQFIDDWQPYSRQGELALIESFLAAAGAEQIENTDLKVFRLPELTPETAAPLPSAPPVPLDVEKRLPVMQSWRFATLAPHAWQWRFPGGARVQTARGAMFTCERPGEGFIMLRNVHLDASEIGAIAIECTYESRSGEVAEFSPVSSVTAFWAQPGDRAPDEWPFSNSCSFGLGPVDPQNPSLFIGLVNKHGNWEGAISDIGLRVSLSADEEPPPQPEKMHVVVRAIYLIRPLS